MDASYLPVYGVACLSVLVVIGGALVPEWLKSVFERRREKQRMGYLRRVLRAPGVTKGRVA